MSVVTQVPAAVACRQAVGSATGAAIAWILVTEAAAGPALLAPLPAALRALGVALVAYVAASLALRRAGEPVERDAFRSGAVAAAIVGLPLAIYSVFRLSLCTACSTTPDVTGGLWAGGLAGLGLWLATWLAGRFATAPAERWRPALAPQ